MVHLNPLDLPEIRLLVANHLDRHNLVHCLLVNKGWYNSFIPFIWRNIAWKEAVVKCKGDSENAVGLPVFKIIRRGPSPEYLERHRLFVYNLRADNIDSYECAFSYPNLQSLFYRGPFFENDPLPLLKLNQSLAELELLNYGRGTQDGIIWKVLQEQPHLKKLVLKTCYVAENSAAEFWKFCQKLETLQLIDTEVSQSTGLAEITFPRMRNLYLGAMVRFRNASPLHLFEKCPGLESLRYMSTPDDIILHIMNDTWPRLHSLTLWTSLMDSDIVCILQGVRQAENLNFRETGFGALAFQTLGRHFATLTELDISQCHSVTSTMVRDILCFCPRLEFFQADRVLATDIANGGPWECLSMVELTVYIEFPSSDDNLHQPIFDRLSQLVKLRVLVIGQSSFREGVETSYGLDISLSKGLGLLGGLKLLRSLNVGETRQMMRAKDVEWIVANWRSLRIFHGVKNSVDPDIDQEVECLLIQHGVNVTRDPSLTII
ncbi:hypothetical protein BGX27_003890 [Mortierella sp. AM989]|nr:hypothetical protein BGX27_003890 [Mortierella sp. AM989]